MNSTKEFNPTGLASAFPAWSFGKITNVEKLAGDVSTRQYFRIFCQKDDGSENEKSLMLQVSQPFERNGEHEHPFLAARELLATAGVPVPKILGVNAELG